MHKEEEVINTANQLDLQRIQVTTLRQLVKILAQIEQRLAEIIELKKE